MYDLDAVDYVVGGDKNLSAIDKTKAYVGEGKMLLLLRLWAQQNNCLVTNPILYSEFPRVACEALVANREVG